MNEVLTSANWVAVPYWYCIDHHVIAEGEKGLCPIGVEQRLGCMLYQLGYHAVRIGTG